ncbi:Vacuolar protein sorting-associated protein VTA1 -like protein [Halotydeus destructor]|nr:Vacuolar protein sorting-associated protein VTA1 -like protein [Halotydeus destructor]
MDSAPPPPASLKPIVGYLKLATDNERFDPVVSYWCRFYALQNALQIDSKSKEAKTFLVYMMDYLEKEKRARKDNEAISNEMVAQAHVENYAIKFFEKADYEERSGMATLNTAKIYLASSQLFEVLSVFGELTPEISQRKKYAKWRTTVIMKAIKNGEQPPLPEDNEFAPQQPGYPVLPSQPNLDNEFGEPSSNSNYDSLPPMPKPPQPEPDPDSALSTFQPASSSEAEHHCQGTHEAQVDTALIMKAQKYIKFAGSALQYNDTATAAGFLRKALSLIETGSE